MKFLSTLFLVFLGINAVVSAQTNTNTAAGANVNVNANAAPASSPPVDPTGAFLRAAVMRNDLTQAADLLGHGAPVDAKGSGGLTPLILAAMRNPEMVKLLLAHGASLELEEDQNYTAFSTACVAGKTGCGLALLDAGAKIETLNKWGHTPLMLAAQSGDDDLVKALIARHADVNKGSNEGSAIWWAVGRGRLGETTLLINAGADFASHLTVPLDPGAPGITLLGSAILNKNNAMIDLLLAHGADVNGPFLDGETPLIVAVRYIQAPTVLHLLEKGADASRPDKEGNTPLMYAVEYLHEDVWQALLQHGAALEEKNPDGGTALIWACLHLYSPAVHFLVNHGADVNAEDVHGNTALYYAGDRGSTEVVQFLKSRGAKRTDLHIIAKESPTPPLPLARRWALAVSAIYSQWNGISPNELGGGSNGKKMKNMLMEDWGIHDRATLLRAVNELRFRGSWRRYQTTGARLAAIPNFFFWLTTFRDSTTNNELKAIRQNYQEWQSRSGLAGDLCRAANLVNSGFASHYIDETEAWNLLLPIARDTQAHFASWHEMCDNFLDAREMWTGDSNPELDACGDLLCNNNDPNSPWNQIPWRTDLSTAQ